MNHNEMNQELLKLIEHYQVAAGKIDGDLNQEEYGDFLTLKNLLSQMAEKLDRYRNSPEKKFMAPILFEDISRFYEKCLNSPKVQNSSYLQVLIKDLQIDAIVHDEQKIQIDYLQEEMEKSFRMNN